MKRYALAVLASGTWVNLCEFLRNEVVLKGQWEGLYEELGLEFPDAPINAALWVVWGFVFSACLVTLRQKLSSTETCLVGRVMGFVLMWIVIGNLQVLPLGILPIAVPWSMVEVGLAVFLAQQIMGNPTRSFR
jgi:hypothetical protein